ncbi:MAG: uroporphyrinogen-III synthase [Deltaproteobacteria bacterium]|nr:uroporphyrinogen-III synthase [Deltaproteobacteria bacterium]
MNLTAKTILITRPMDQAADTIAQFEAKGAKVIHIPLIAIVPPSDGYAGLDRALAELSSYDWILFTSQNAVAAFFSRPGAKENMRAALAAVGTKTAEALSRQGLKNIIVPKDHHAEGLLTVLAEHPLAGKKVLFPRAKEGRDVLADGLRSLGAKVDLVEAYQTILPKNFDEQRLISLIAEEKLDGIHFASPSAVKNFMAVVKRAGLEAKLERLTFFAIGPATKAALEKAGLNSRPEE